MNNDKATAETTNPEPTPVPEPKTLNLTQEELNDLLGKVRTETRTQGEKELAKTKAEYEEKMKLAAMEKEERAKAEKEMELKKLNDELAQSRRELRLKAAEAELAKSELDPGFAQMVLGEDDKGTGENCGRQSVLSGRISRPVLRCGVPQQFLYLLGRYQQYVMQRPQRPL